MTPAERLAAMETPITDSIARGWSVYWSTRIYSIEDSASLVAEYTDALLKRVREIEKERALALEALRIVAGEKQCADNLMSDVDVAMEALSAIRAAEQERSNADR